MRIPSWERNGRRRGSGGAHLRVARSPVASPWPGSTQTCVRGGPHSGKVRNPDASSKPNSAQSCAAKARPCRLFEFHFRNLPFFGIRISEVCIKIEKMIKALQCNAALLHLHGRILRKLAPRRAALWQGAKSSCIFQARFCANLHHGGPPLQAFRFLFPKSAVFRNSHFRSLYQNGQNDKSSAARRSPVASPRPNSVQSCAAAGRTLEGTKQSPPQASCSRPLIIYKYKLEQQQRIPKVQHWEKACRRPLQRRHILL